MSSSSSAALARSRSLRKPAPPPRTDLAPADGQAAGDASAAPRETRNASPSRLPVKPVTRSTSTSIAVSASSTSAGTAGTRSARPISGVFGRTVSTRLAREKDKDKDKDKDRDKESGGSESGTKAAERGAGASSSTTTGSSRYPPSSSLTRPTTSGGLPAAKGRTVSHSRAKSNVTTLTGATVLRPPSQQSAASSTAAKARPASQHGGRPPSRDFSSLGNRTIAPSTAASTTAAARPPSRDPTNSTVSVSHAGAAVGNLAAQPRLRPAFTTLQQHYSPARNLAPKPLTSTFLAPPSPSKLPSNVALSAETSRQQTELLHLHLLHRGAAVTEAQWRASARKQLGERFVTLGKANAALSTQEAERVERVNVRALQRWGAHAQGVSPQTGGGRPLEEKIQTLDAVLSGLWSLGEPGGKYARVVRRFERWAERMADIDAARQRGSTSGLLEGEDVVFIGELDAAWKEDCAGLVRRLEHWWGDVQRLGNVSSLDGSADEIVGAATDADRSSSLARMLAACTSLVGDMLAELALMGRIEADALRQEAEWMRNMNREDEAVDGAPRAGAIWRAF